MALFRRDDPDAPRGVAPGEAAPRGSHAEATRAESERSAATVIAHGTKIQGTVAGAVEVRVEGEVEGRVDLEGTLTVGPRGRVQGDVRARIVRVAGCLVGNIDAVDRVELASSGRIEGDVVAPRVAIAEGGFCQGRIEMTRARSTAAERAEESQAPAASPGSATKAPRPAALGSARADA
jgi:cytoskeletal protein CcmA (bactofilin family)